MNNTFFWVAALSIALVGTACGDDSDNGGAGSGGSSATGGTGGAPSGDTCTAICSNACVVELSDLSADDIEQCEQDCGLTLRGCESETLDFLNCIENFECDQNDAAIQCQSEALAYAQCFL